MVIQAEEVQLTGKKKRKNGDEEMKIGMKVRTSTPYLMATPASVSNLETTCSI